jgi:hypothetical protein
MRDYPLRKEVKLLEEGKWIEAVGENTASQGVMARPSCCGRRPT